MRAGLLMFDARPSETSEINKDSSSQYKLRQHIIIGRKAITYLAADLKQLGFQMR